MSLAFSIIMGFVESFFSRELCAYLEKYHQKKVAQLVANAPVTDSEWTKAAEQGKL